MSSRYDRDENTAIRKKRDHFPNHLVPQRSRGDVMLGRKIVVRFSRMQESIIF